MHDLAVYAVSLVVCLALCLFLAWELWLGLTKGYMHSRYAGRVERAKSPISFWVGFVFCAVGLVMVGLLAVFIAVFAIVHPSTGA
jgi:ABC-type Fe3+ transport system permease subunit